MNIRESEKKATDEKIQSLLSKTQKLDSKLRDSQLVEKTLEAKLREIQNVEAENRELKKNQEKILNESRVTQMSSADK